MIKKAVIMHCQSCGMAMTEESHFGNNVDGSKSEDYCCHCWKKQNIENVLAKSRENYPLVVPRILLNGQSNEALKLYKKAFNAIVKDKILFVDADPTDFQYTGKEKDNLVYYSLLMIGKHMVMVSDDASGILSNSSGRRPSLTAMCVSFDSEEKARAAYEVLSDGATILMPITSSSYGLFEVSLEDKFGVVWDLYYGTP